MICGHGMAWSCIWHCMQPALIQTRLNNILVSIHIYSPKFQYSPISEPNPTALPLKAWSAPSPKSYKSQSCWRWKGNSYTPPDDPPADRPWLCGFQAYPRILLLVSPDCSEVIKSQIFGKCGNPDVEGLLTQRLCTNVVFTISQYAPIDLVVSKSDGLLWQWESLLDCTTLLSTRFRSFSLCRFPYSLQSANPARVSHRRIQSLDVPLIFHAHGQTMQWTHSRMVLFVVAVQLFRSLERHIEGNFQEIPILWDC